VEKEIDFKEKTIEVINVVFDKDPKKLLRFLNEEFNKELKTLKTEEIESKIITQIFQNNQKNFEGWMQMVLYKDRSMVPKIIQEFKKAKENN
jgi:hypothetical protein